MKAFLARQWDRTWVRAVVMILTALVLWGVFAWVYPSPSDNRQWSDAQQRVKKEGESLDFHIVAPAPIPDSVNFCAIPALKDLPLIKEDTDKNTEAGRKRARLTVACIPQWVKGVYRPALKEAALGTPTDLTVWADYLRKAKWFKTQPASQPPAEDVLAALTRNDALIDELAAGLSRPAAQWTPAWKNRPEPGYPDYDSHPHLQVATDLTIMLSLRAIAAARVGNAASASQSLLIALRLNQADMNEPFLLANFSACQNSAAICNAIWEMCNAHTGSAEDFRLLQDSLSHLDFQKDLLLAERGELAKCIPEMEWCKRVRSIPWWGPPRSLISETYGKTMMRYAPDSWYDTNAATLVNWQLDYQIDPLRDGNFQELIEKQKELYSLIRTDAPKLPFEHSDELLAVNALSYKSMQNPNAMYAQSLVNEAIAACALERHRIEHGAYPDTLAAANRPGEKSIPPDAITGKPMGYRKTADGRYALWSIAINGVDHGGVRILDNVHPELTIFDRSYYKGDWLWDFQGKPAAPAEDLNAFPQRRLRAIAIPN